MAIVSTNNSEHYHWGKQCEGWHLLKAPGLSVIQESVPGGRGEIRHYHERSEQFFYVLAGTASLEVDDEQHSLQANEGLHVPAGRAHRLCNHNSETLTFLVISAPPSHADRIDIEDLD